MDETHSQPVVPTENNTQDTHEWVYDESLDSSADTVNDTQKQETKGEEKVADVSKSKENFFDRNISFFVAISCIFPFMIIVNVVLAIFNFRKKQAEIFRGIGYYFLFFMVLALIGFGLCMLIVAGLGGR